MIFETNYRTISETKTGHIFVGGAYHVFSVGLGSGGGLLSVPDGLHLGQVGAVLQIIWILSRIKIQSLFANMKTTFESGKKISLSRNHVFHQGLVLIICIWCE